MKSISLIDSFNLKVKCLHIFIIAILFIILTDSTKYSLPDELSESMIEYFFNEISLLSC